MSGYVSIGAYDATLSIPQFKGLMQYGEGINSDPTYAADAVNVETRAGVLQPVAACELLLPTIAAPIETLMRLHRRWHTQDDEKDLLVAASAGKLYAMLPGASAWTQLSTPISFTNNKWSWVTYEINPEGSTASVDVLLISNADDGMYMIRGDNLGVSAVPTPKKFGVIERYAERIWGGAIKDDPDMLVYSAPYDPTNWTANVEIPEDGAGDLNQPSWDGDSFTALRAFGSQLITFKRTRVWRVLGTDPGEYTFKEQYGGGCAYEKTIAVDTERILMLSDKGVVAYDGLAVGPFYQQYAEDVWKKMRREGLENASATMWQGRYYLAIPLNGSEINNAVIVYNPVDNTWLLRDDVFVEDFLATEDTLYFTSSTTPGQIWRWREDSWEAGVASAAATRWVSPWNDLSAKSITKGGFEVYLLPEVQDAPATLSISIQTEKKIKTKQYIARPLTEVDKRGQKSAKQKKIHFGGTGRRFRLIIESPPNSPPWRLVSGVMIVAELDPD